MNAPPPLIDSFGRVVDDLRISITDRCNFRCVYCMPADGLRWLPTSELLAPAEIVRLARLFVAMGTRTIRLTGGEPLVRPGIVDLVSDLARLHPELDLALTTNGFFLRRHAAALAAAGLRRVNVSLDSLRAERFAAMTRRASLSAVLDGIAAARDAGLSPIKINVVVMRGFNDDEVTDFGRFARDQGLHVRFIEFMPLDGDASWERDHVVAGEELLQAMDNEFPLQHMQNGSDPATRYGFADGAAGEVGFINSVSAPFCATCNRVRLTADGQLRTCLFAETETDLRTPLQRGDDDDVMTALIRSALWNKRAGHHINDPDFARPLRSMSQIGG